MVYKPSEKQVNLKEMNFSRFILKTDLKKKIFLALVRCSKSNKQQTILLRFEDSIFRFSSASKKIEQDLENPFSKGKK